MIVLRTHFAVVLALLLSGGAASAADNAIVLTPGVGVTERSIDVGTGVQAPGVVPVGVTGASAWGTAGSANTNVLTVQGVASMTPLITQGDGASGAALAGNPFRVALSDGTNAQNWLAAIILGDTVNGNNTGAVAPWLYNGTTWDRARGDATNGAWVNIKACAAGICNSNGQAAMASSAPVTLASNQSVADPCTFQAKKSKPINLTASGQIIAANSTNKIYICAIHLVTATAQNIALVEGTVTVCGTNTYGLAGGATAATGWNFSANSGIALGNGSSTVISPDADTNAAGAAVCLLLSSSGQTSGTVTFVQQ